MVSKYSSLAKSQSFSSFKFEFCMWYCYISVAPPAPPLPPGGKKEGGKKKGGKFFLFVKKCSLPPSNEISDDVMFPNSGENQRKNRERKGKRKKKRKKRGR